LGVLGASRLFGRLDREVLRQLRDDFHGEHIESGQVIPRERLSAEFFIVEGGRVERVYSDRESGRELTLETLRSGGGFSLLSVLDGEPSQNMTVAAETSSLLAVPVSVLRRWLPMYPDLSAAFFRELSEQLRRLESLAGELACSNTLTRLARLLVHHAVDHSSSLLESHEHLPLEIDLTQEELARMIGSVRVVVNRHLQTLSRLDAVELERGKIRIRDFERLSELCELPLREHLRAG